MSNKKSAPSFLPVGTEVSARFKGAYCEARIDEVQRSLKVKVSLKEYPFGTITVQDEDLPNAKFILHEMTDVTLTRSTVRCQITNIQDKSRYHVAFNDGDNTWLRRTQMCIKSLPHFDREISLDAMPLTNPEAFGNALRGAARRGLEKMKFMTESGHRKNKFMGVFPGMENGRGKRRAANAAVAAIGELNQSTDTHSDEDVADNVEEKEKKKQRKKKNQEDQAGPSSTRDSSVDTLASNQKNEPSSSGAANGVLTAKEEKARLAKMQKQLNKEKKREEKEREKEQERQQKLLEREEKNRQKEIDKVRKAQQQLLKEARDRKKAQFKTAHSFLKKLHRKNMKKVPTHRSMPFFLRLNIMKALRNEKKPALRGSSHKKWKNCGYPFKPYGQKARIRHHTLARSWKRRVETMSREQWSYRPAVWRNRPQFWKVPKKFFRVTTRSANLLASAERYNLVENFLRRLDKHDRVKIVLWHEDYRMARKLIRYVNRDMEDHSFEERFRIDPEDLHSQMVQDHFKETEWYTAIMLPGVIVDPESGRNQRIIRHMGTKQLMKVWEDDLIPYHWIPPFNMIECCEIMRSRPEHNQRNFRLGWRFANDVEEHRLDMTYITRRIRAGRLKDAMSMTEKTCIKKDLLSDKEDVQDIVGPAPTDEPPAESDYDSDDDIKKDDSTTNRDHFTASLLYHFDLIKQDIPTADPVVQGYEVSLYYFYRLIWKMGGPKKFFNSNPWTKVSKKLIPRAIDAEEDIKGIYKKYLESYTKAYPFQDSDPLPRGGRSNVVPGGYSEAKQRKRKIEPDAPECSSSSTAAKRRSRDGSTPVAAKKSRGRKSASKESNFRMRSTDRSSKEPGPSNVVILDDDGGSEAEIEYESRSMSTEIFKRRAKDQRDRASLPPGHARSWKLPQPTQPPKKGRPRKNEPKPKPEYTTTKKLTAMEMEQWQDYMGANIISSFEGVNKLGAFYGDLWYEATVINEESLNIDRELLSVMLSEQSNSGSNWKEPISDGNSEIMEELMKRLLITVHYTGWNNRYDEAMSMPRVLISKADQEKSRKRFLDMPGGEKLFPETVAKVEYKFQHWRDRYYTEHTENTVKKKFTLLQLVQLARIAFGQDPDCESDKGLPKVVPYKAVVDEPQPSTSQQQHDSSSDDDDDDKDNVVKRAADVDVTEEAEPQPGSSSTVVMNADGCSENEEDEEKEGDDTDQGGESDKNDGAHEMDPVFEVKQEEKYKYEPIDGELESESDEPDYPPGPSAEQLMAMEIPILRTIPSLQSTSSNQSIPCLTPQNSVISIGSPLPNEPTLLPQTDNLLAYSGPLTLDEVKPAMPPTTTKVESHDNENTELLEEGSGVVDSDEPVVKRQQLRASQGDELLVPSTLLLQQQREPSLPITSGALHLEIQHPTESSGPLEPTPTVSTKRGRKKTATPATQKQSPMTSGPLTLSQVTPAPTTPIRPLKKKISAEPLVVTTIAPESAKLDEEETLSPKDEIEEDLTNAQTDDFASGESSSGKDSVSESRAATSRSATPMTIVNDDDETVDTDEPQSESQTTSRGIGSVRGKKRKGGRVSHSSKPIKIARKKEENAEEKEQNDEQSEPNNVPTTPTTPASSSRTDSFQTQKTRLSKQYDSKELNEKEDFLLLKLKDFDQWVESSPAADMILFLEERTNELREIHAQAKTDVAQLERRWRLQNEAKRKARERTASSTPSADN